MLRCEETAHIAVTLIRRNGQRAEVYVINPMFPDISKLFSVLASAFDLFSVGGQEGLYTATACSQESSFCIAELLPVLRCHCDIPVFQDKNSRSNEASVFIVGF